MMVSIYGGFDLRSCGRKEKRRVQTAKTATATTFNWGFVRQIREPRKEGCVQMRVRVKEKAGKMRSPHLKCLPNELFCFSILSRSHPSYPLLLPPDLTLSGVTKHRCPTKTITLSFEIL